jgi:outer membrane receptor protein involved in Fe transport
VGSTTATALPPAPCPAAVSRSAVLNVGLTVNLFKIYNSYAKTLKVGLDFNNLLNKYYFNYADTSTEENHFGTLTEFASPGAPRNVMGRIEVGF